VFVPAGPMTTGLSNSEKAKIRQLYAQGKVGRDELLEGEPSPTTAPAPAPSTAPPTATRC
jgi:dihydroxyacid dehydratase/phosphogluconate dehydratase